LSVESSRYWARRITRRRFTAGAAAAGVLIGSTPIFAACSSGDDDDDDATGSSGASGASRSLSTSGATSSGSTISEFVVANEAEPLDLLPYFGGYGQGLVTRAIYQTLIEPRMTLNSDGSVKVSYEGSLARWPPACWPYSC
jgi:hypothetical protein